MPASARADRQALTTGTGGPTTERRGPNLVRWIEAIAVVFPTAAFVVVMFVLAFFFSVGVLLGLFEHLRRGDPAWQSDLLIAALLVGSAAGGVVGVLGLAMAVFADPHDLAKTPSRCLAVVVALIIGLTTAAGLLTSGFWPRTDAVMTYPLIAPAIVAAYRLPLLIRARTESG